MIKPLPPLFFIFSIFVMTEIAHAQFRYGNELENADFRVLSSIGGNLYSGIDNYLTISSDILINSDTIHITSTNGEVFADSGRTYLLIPKRPGKVRLTFYSVNGTDTSVIGYKHFTVKKVPDPQLVINNSIVHTSDTIMKRSFLESDSLFVYISNDIVGSENWLTVSEFVIGYNYGGFHVSHKNPSGRILSETKRIITYIAPDREISIKLTVKAEGKVFTQLPIYRITVY
jgi:hypothetical protein